MDMDIGRLPVGHRAGRPTARAMLRCLGYSATIAIAGCGQPSPKAVVKAMTGEAEAGLSCYYSAEDYVAYQDVATALRDGTLTANECDNIVMPHVRASNAAALVRVKQRAVRAASGMEARRAAAENTDAVHDSPTAAPSGGDAHTSAVKKGR